MRHHFLFATSIGYERQLSAMPFLFATSIGHERWLLPILHGGGGWKFRDREGVNFTVEEVEEGRCQRLRQIGFLGLGKYLLMLEFEIQSFMFLIFHLPFQAHSISSHNNSFFHSVTRKMSEIHDGWSSWWKSGIERGRSFSFDTISCFSCMFLMWILKLKGAIDWRANELRLPSIADVYLFFRTTDHRIHSRAPRRRRHRHQRGAHHPFPLLPPSIIAANNKQLRSLQRSRKWLVRGLVKFVPAVAWLFCLALLGSCLARLTNLLRALCRLCEISFT